MSLRDLIAKAILSETDEQGRLNLPNAVTKVISEATDDDLKILARDALTKRVKSQAARSAKEGADRNSEVLSLFPDLHHRYALGRNDKVMVTVDELSEFEMVAIIGLREKQSEDDLEHVRVLRLAYAQAKPLWKRHPDLKFGQICKRLKKAA